MHKITLIPGDGIGPEVAFAAKKVLDSIIDVKWDIVNAGVTEYEKTGTLVPNNVYEAIEKNKVALKGPITTLVGKGFKSINVSLRKKYNLFANIRPIKDLSKNINLVIFRENTEGLYIGEEKHVSEEVVEATKRITKTGSINIITAAFDFAQKNCYNKVTVVHKANILKLSDGLFLKTAREISKNYSDIELEEIIVDAMCMHLVMTPSKFQVIVTMNLYGDILSDLGAGLIGGLGLVPGANIGDKYAIFEAVHGTAPNIAGKSMANPIAMIRSSVMLLHHISESEKAMQLERAVNLFLDGNIKTADLGGTNTTTEVADEVIRIYKSLKGVE